MNPFLMEHPGHPSPYWNAVAMEAEALSKTDSIAAKMKEFDPDSTWQPSKD